MSTDKVRMENMLLISVSLLFSCFFNGGRNKEEGKRKIRRRDRHTLKERDSGTETEKDRVRHTHRYMHTYTHAYWLMDRKQRNYISMLPFYDTSVKCTLGKFFCPSANINWRFHSTLLISLQVFLDILYDGVHHFS